ncbi:hypothetical protein GFL85_13745 [Rhizobium laguerreae]|uniref:hypothetical protein n=1 Tax=Rhizobium laguerreae TaxID=1076926 RepID=UPI00143F2F64|nr:hypothetical protein [Rhizobium laguerreae]NKM12082.1 hypothetical protein [Rhizobium laguerreae]
MTRREDAAGPIVTREELYRMLWEEPATKVAGRLGVSNRLLAQKICPKLDVPFPGLGYWRKRKVGRAPPTPPLPERRPGTDQFWQKGERPKQPPHSRQTVPEKRRRAKPKPSPHPLVRDICVRLVMNGIGGDDSYLLPPGKRRLADILVTDGTLGRALRFADRLYQTLEAEGYRVMIAPVSEGLSRRAISSGGDGRPGADLLRWAPARPTVAYIYGAPIGLALVEESEAVEMRYVGGGHYVRERDFRSDEHFGPTWTVEQEHPAGRLKLVAYSPFNPFPWTQTWRDGAKMSLESQLGPILGALEQAAIVLERNLARAGWYFEPET